MRSPSAARYKLVAFGAVVVDRSWHRRTAPTLTLIRFQCAPATKERIIVYSTPYIKCLRVWSPGPSTRRPGLELEQETGTPWRHLRTIDYIRKGSCRWFRVACALTQRG